MKKLITIMSLAVVGFTFAQEEEPTFKVSGSVDAYFSTSLTGPNDQDNQLTNGSYTAPPSSIMGTDQRGFSLGMANITFSYEGEKVGFIADMAFGPRADAQFFDYDVVNEAYMYWNASEKVTLVMGRFNSWMGMENFSAANNFHYSYSHMYTFAPRNFNGIAAQFDLGSDLGFGVGVMNPIDITLNNQTGNYSIGAGISKGNSGISVLSSEDETFVDAKLQFKVTEKFNLGLNAHVASWDDDASLTGNRSLAPGTEGFTSISAYPQIKSSETLSWGLRLEHITFKGDGDLSVFTPTLTANYSVGALTIKPELRLDSSSKDIFANRDMDGVTGSMTSFTMAAVYQF
jgi:hypothetical protein